MCKCTKIYDECHRILAMDVHRNMTPTYTGF